MSSEKTTGIVLRIVEFSESSCIITWMTRDFGKITTLAKGARRRKSPVEGAIDLLSVSRIVFLHKKADSLDLLTEAKLERRFKSAASDLNRLYAGYYVLELLAAMTDENDPHPELFELACDVLGRIDSEDGILQQIFRLEVGALGLLGHSPMLENCVGCGRKKTLENTRVNFGLQAGGIYCATCRKGKINVVSLSSEAWKSLVQVSQLSGPATVVTEDCQSELRKFLDQYIAHHLGYRPRLQKYITGIKS